MASFDINGILKVKKDTQVVSEKFSKREFVLTIDTQSQYPQYISLQLTQDKCSLLDQFNTGDEMKVSFNLRGREWSGPDGIRYFNTLEAWRLEKVSGSTSTFTPSNYPASVPAESSVSKDDDLPF
ncbi:MAG TPA: DUF3127 domain-containing protein [Chitinophagaceae bacterium]|nr:DUF3127 domain-containing protein [Chitinophagaceae bacterium]HNF70794.1 DUF3127 domain-containing protein [Chitinophagaceae bacterium]